MAARTRKKTGKKNRTQNENKAVCVVYVNSCSHAWIIGRLMFIEYTSGDAYTKKVLSLQSYDSKTIPFQRGNIVDSNGTVLATSVAVL